MSKRNSKEGREYEDVKDLLSKWAPIPYGIVTLLVGGSALNLIGYFLNLKDDLGFDPFEQELVRWAVAGGFYWGILAGPFIHVLGNKIWFLASSISSLIGFIVLGFYTDEYYVRTVSSVIIIILLAVVSFWGAISSIATISTIVKNFGKNMGLIWIPIMITYYMISPYFEKCIRAGFFKDDSFKKLLILTGIVQAWIYGFAAFVIQENEYSLRVEKVSAIIDRFGVLVFAVIEGAFLLVIYFTWIIAEEWKSGVLLMVALIWANFVAFGVIILTLLHKIKDANVENVDIQQNKDKRNLLDMLTNPNYYWLLVSTFIVVGSCTAYHLEAPSIAYAMKKPELGPRVMKEFWIWDVAMRFCGGIIIGLFSQILNPYLCLSFTGFFAMFGFGIALLSQPIAPIFFYISSFFIGGSVGSYWTIVPQIILLEWGKKGFEILWGTLVFVNVLGVLLFDKFFMWIDNKEEPYEVGFWQGISWYLASYITSAILWGFAGGICLLAYLYTLKSDSINEDPKSKSRDKNEKKSKSDNS